jgi:hypothetical protein
MDTLLSLSMRVGEMLKDYSTRYWETYNEIDGCKKDLAMKTFKFGLLLGSKLRQFLAKRLVQEMTNLMSQIEQYVRVEEDSL